MLSPFIAAQAAFKSSVSSKRMEVEISPAKSQEVQLCLPLPFPVGAYDQKLLRMKKQPVPSHSSQYFLLEYLSQQSRAIPDILALGASGRNIRRP